MNKTMTPEEKAINIKVKKNLMWIGIVSIVILFAGLTSAYIIAIGKPGFVQAEVPVMFWVSAGVIATSSISMIYAVRSARSNRFSSVMIGSLLTFMLGIGFCVCQVLGWGQLVDQKIFFVQHPSGQYLYMLSGVHLAHLFFGMISLIVVVFKAMKRAYSSTEHLGLEIAAMYWHFLGILWIYLLVFLQIVR